jgi:hypothetical protein
VCLLDSKVISIDETHTQKHTKTTITIEAILIFIIHTKKLIIDVVMYLLF